MYTFITILLYSCKAGKNHPVWCCDRWFGRCFVCGRRALWIVSLKQTLKLLVVLNVRIHEDFLCLTCDKFGYWHPFSQKCASSLKNTFERKSSSAANPFTKWHALRMVVGLKRMVKLNAVGIQFQHSATDIIHKINDVDVLPLRPDLPLKYSVKLIIIILSLIFVFQNIFLSNIRIWNVLINVHSKTIVEVWLYFTKTHKLKYRMAKFIFVKDM